MKEAQLIVLDDEVNIANLVCQIGGKFGLDCHAYTDPSLFKEKYDNSADIIILDLMMPNIDGIEIIRFLSKIKCNAEIILMSGFDSGVLHSAQKLATEHGLNLVGSLNKPFRPAELTGLFNSLTLVPKITNSTLKTELESAEVLRRAILNNEMVVYYQPKINLKNNTMPAVEALVRWQHPEKGLIFPDSFIPTAESNNLIDDLTWLVMEQSMNQCKLWKAQGLYLQVAVNMSANTLKDLSIPEKIEALVRKHELDTSQIILEITESALMQELITSLDILTRLRMKGFHLSIDDFGTGFSSLIQLYRAPFSEIKIDKSFVFEMEHDIEAETIVETIIMMGKNLNMKTIAEGVETEHCKDKLSSLGCDLAQGYLFSRPMPKDEVFDWHSKHLKS